MMRRDTRGTSLIEFALLAPVFVLLLMGVIEVGRYTYFGILAAHGARAGVQYGAQDVFSAADAAANGANTRNAVLQDAQGLANWTVHSSLVCTINGQPTNCPSNTASAVQASLVYYVQVDVSGTFNSLMKYPGIPRQIPVSATAVMPLSSQ
jgi:Flp pilus assembly protein TadG